MWQIRRCPRSHDSHIVLTVGFISNSICFSVFSSCALVCMLAHVIIDTRVCVPNANELQPYAWLARNQKVILVWRSKVKPLHLLKFRNLRIVSLFWQMMWFYCLYESVTCDYGGGWVACSWMFSSWDEVQHLVENNGLCPPGQAWVGALSEGVQESWGFGHTIWKLYSTVLNPTYPISNCNLIYTLGATGWISLTASCYVSMTCNYKYY